MCYKSHGIYFSVQYHIRSLDSTHTHTHTHTHPHTLTLKIKIKIIKYYYDIENVSKYQSNKIHQSESNTPKSNIVHPILYKKNCTIKIMKYESYLYRSCLALKKWFSLTKVNFLFFYKFSYLSFCDLMFLTEICLTDPVQLTEINMDRRNTPKWL